MEWMRLHFWCLPLIGMINRKSNLWNSNRIGRGRQLMMQDNTICEGGSTLVFSFATETSFSSVALVGNLFFLLFIGVIPDCFVSFDVYAAGIVLFRYQWGRVRAHSLRFFASFFSLALSPSTSCFFPHIQKKEAEREKGRRSSATYNGSTTTRK